jgi:hypothetical protein
VKILNKKIFLISLILLILTLSNTVFAGDSVGFAYQGYVLDGAYTTADNSTPPNPILNEVLLKTIDGYSYNKEKYFGDIVFAFNNKTPSTETKFINSAELTCGTSKIPLSGQLLNSVDDKKVLVFGSGATGKIGVINFVDGKDSLYNLTDVPNSLTPRNPLVIILQKGFIKAIIQRDVNFSNVKINNFGKTGLPADFNVFVFDPASLVNIYIPKTGVSVAFNSNMFQSSVGKTLNQGEKLTINDLVTTNLGLNTKFNSPIISDKLSSAPISTGYTLNFANVSDVDKTIFGNTITKFNVTSTTGTISIADSFFKLNKKILGLINSQINEFQVKFVEIEYDKKPTDCKVNYVNSTGAGGAVVSPPGSNVGNSSIFSQGAPDSLFTNPTEKKLKYLAGYSGNSWAKNSIIFNNFLSVKGLVDGLIIKFNQLQQEKIMEKDGGFEITISNTFGEAFKIKIINTGKISTSSLNFVEFLKKPSNYFGEGADNWGFPIRNDNWGRVRIDLGNKEYFCFDVKPEINADGAFSDALSVKNISFRKNKFCDAS